MNETTKKKIQILHFITRAILFEAEVETLRDAVILAVQKRADLSGAYLSGADLRGADLRGAYLSGAYLSGADLSGADLRGAYLSGAYLSGADLSGADLSGADLSGAKLPAPTVILLANWGQVADQLCADLMLYDASCHPDPDAFARWAASPSGPCPYSDCSVERAAVFQERRALWGKGVACRPFDLMTRLLSEKCPEWSKEQRKEFRAKFKDALDIDDAVIPSEFEGQPVFADEMREFVGKPQKVQGFVGQWVKVANYLWPHSALKRIDD